MTDLTTHPRMPENQGIRNKEYIDMTETVTPDGEIIVREPEPLPVLTQTLGEREIYRRVEAALALPGTTNDIGGNRHVNFIGSACVASSLGVSVSTEIAGSGLSADGEVEYTCRAKVLGPHGSIVSVETLYSMADARNRRGGKLDRGQAVNLCSTRAFNRAMRVAWGRYMFAPRPDGSAAPAVSTVDDAAPDEWEGGTREVPPFENEEEAEAAARTYSEQVHAAKGDKDQVQQIHGDAVRRGLRWDKEFEEYVVA